MPRDTVSFVEPIADLEDGCVPQCRHGDGPCSRPLQCTEAGCCLDAAHARRTETAPDLATPSLAGLAWLLRREEAWPEGFRWNFANCPTCAIGLAYRMVCGEAPEARFGPTDAAAWLPRAFPALSDPDGFLVESAEKIFFGDVAFDLGIGLDDVTPEMVAQRIEDHLAGQL